MSDQPFTLRVRDPDKWKPLLDLTARAIGIVATALGSSTMVAFSVLASMTVPIFAFPLVVVAMAALAALRPAGSGGWSRSRSATA
jgi:hypothetical protein